SVVSGSFVDVHSNNFMTSGTQTVITGGWTSSVTDLLNEDPGYIDPGMCDPSGYRYTNANLTLTNSEEPFLGSQGLLPQTDLSLTKTDSVDPVSPGNSLLYTLLVENVGNVAATGVVVVDDLDPNAAT